MRKEGIWGERRGHECLQQLCPCGHETRGTGHPNANGDTTAPAGDALSPPAPAGWPGQLGRSATNGNEGISPRSLLENRTEGKSNKGVSAPRSYLGTQLPALISGNLRVLDN